MKRGLMIPTPSPAGAPERSPGRKPWGAGVSTPQTLEGRQRYGAAHPTHNSLAENGTRVAIYALLPLLMYAVPAFAQAPAVVVATDDEAPPATSNLVQLTVRSAGPPRPSLKYVLLPSLPDQMPGNAEPLYYMAAHLFADQAKDEFGDKLTSWLEVPLSELPREEIRRALDEQAAALRQLRLATHRDWCHWELTIRSEGIHAILPALSKFRSLARLLAVKARLEVSERRYDDAIDTLQSGFAMARHIGEASSLIHSLVGVAIASLMADRVTEFIQAPEAPNFYWALTDLPRPFVDLRGAVQSEMWMAYFTVPELRNLAGEGMTPRQLEATSDKVFEIAGFGPASGLDRTTHWGPRLGRVAWTIKAYPKAKRHLISLGRSPQAVEAMPVQQVVLLAALDQYNYWRDEVFKWFGLPYWQAREGLKETEKRFSGRAEQQGYPFTVLLPSVGRAYFVTTKLDRQIAALQCVEAVRMHAAAHDGRLPASLAEIKVVPVPLDPVTGAAFGYESAGEKATLNAPTPAGQSPKDGVTYEITLTK